MSPGRWSIVVVAVVAVMGAACSKSGGTSTSNKPILIGISLSSSGDFSDPSAAAKKGYEL